MRLRGSPWGKEVTGVPEKASYLERTLCDLVSVRSVTGEEAALSEYIHDHLTRAGVSVRRDEEGHVTAEVGRGERLLVVNGHVDTVPPVDGWKTDPFTPRVEDGRVYGLGASDMKAGLACMM